MNLNLDNKELIESFLHDKFIIGVHHPDHFSNFITAIYNTLALRFININAPIKLVEQELSQKSPNLFGDNINQMSAEFQVFRSTDALDRSQHILYQNRIGTQNLISSLPSLDYIWLVSNVNDLPNYGKQVINKINTIPSVQISRELSASQIKEKIRLII